MKDAFKRACFLVKIHFKNIITSKLAAARSEHRSLADSLKAFNGNSVDSFNFTEFGNESKMFLYQALGKHYTCSHSEILD